MTRDPRRHLVVPGLGGGDEHDAAPELARASDGERALPGTNATQDQDGPGAHGGLVRSLRLGGIACGSPGLPSKTGSECAGSRQVS